MYTYPIDVKTIIQITNKLYYTEINKYIICIEIYILKITEKFYKKHKYILRYGKIKDSIARMARLIGSNGIHKN